jgi:hypothetical protein
MKNPLQVLLEKHRSAGPKLDALRHDFVAGLRQDASVLEASDPSLAAVLWRELFWSCRRVWFGLAGVWALILVLHVSTSADAPATRRVAQTDAPRLAEMLQERQRLQEELLGPTTVAAPAREPEPMRPRSQRTLVVRIC